MCIRPPRAYYNDNRNNHFNYNLLLYSSVRSSRTQYLHIYTRVDIYMYAQCPYGMYAFSSIRFTTVRKCRVSVCESVISYIINVTVS
jgi:hypothetical protein